jgi:REP element-mobilizing transposase RayT
MHWLFEAKKRYGLAVLNFMITSSHIHLLVADDDSKDVISRSMQLVASRTAQEYNWRKNRKGAYWEDRYHATAIERDEHLFRCIVYLDLNMVRAGVVTHPSDWGFSGYNEIQNPRKRYALINYQRLMQLLNIQTVEELKKSHSGWIEEALRNNSSVRESKWVKSVAVGSKEFVEMTKEKLGFQVKGRSVSRSGDNYQLREQQTAYSPLFTRENSSLSDDNTYFWDESDVI